MADCTECDEDNICNDEVLLQKASCNEKTFRWHVIKTLCFISQFLGAEEPAVVEPDTIVLPQVQILAADVETDYPDFAPIANFLDTTKQLKRVRIVNLTNSDLDFSYDSGTTVAFTVVEGTTYVEELKLTLEGLNAFEMRRAVGDTASTGRVIIEGRH